MTPLNPEAFPSPGVVLADGSQQGAHAGMRLRDYFAAAAVTGFLANPGRYLGPETVVAEAYAIADTMMRATR